MLQPTRHHIVAASLLLSLANACQCDEPASTDTDVFPTPEGEGEGEGGEGEGESGGTPVPCLSISYGTDLPARLVTLIDSRLRAAAPPSWHVASAFADGTVLQDPTTGVTVCEPADSRVLSFGETSLRTALISDAELAGLGPEGYVMRTGATGTPAISTIAVAGVTAGSGTHGPSPGGAAYGAYALLEELGFAFMHPLEPHLPVALPAVWPTLDVTTAPRWPVRNIHLHTMHPLELTELLNGWGQGVPEDRASWDAMRPEWDLFLEWMVANGQNEVEWVLLQAGSWEEFATSTERHQRLTLLVDDCHAWGISCGVDTPIVQQQQHTYRLLLDATGDLDEELAAMHARIDYVMSAGFDFMSTESGTTEFTNPGAERMLTWMNEVAIYVDEAWGKPMQIKVHVSHGQTADPYLDPDTGGPLNFNFLPTIADPRVGVNPHTVQMYGLDDPAPTYGNSGFGEIRDFLHREVGRRTVLWHPETAYWVSVDVDVPLFLPLYAERRVADLQLLADDEDLGLMGRAEHAGEHMDGQSFFSSGWEWGYWLNDVACARAAWDPFRGHDNSTDALKEILRPLARALGSDGAAFVDEIARFADLQHDTLILGKVDGIAPDTVVKKNGFAYLAGTEAFDDILDLATDLGIGAPTTQPLKLGMVEMRNPLHAAPRYTGEVDVLLEQMVADFASVDDAVAQLQGSGPLFEELVESVRVTRLRADQVLGLYTYVDNLGDADPAQRMAALGTARAALDEAWTLAQAREAAYRVPADRIAAWRNNPTAYEFTYLWTAHSFYFWWRDEGKAVDAPLSPCYLNIINPADIALGEGSIESALQLINDLATGGFLEDAAGCVTAADDEPTFPNDDLRSRP